MEGNGGNPIFPEHAEKPQKLAHQLEIARSIGMELAAQLVQVRSGNRLRTGSAQTSVQQRQDAVRRRRLDERIPVESRLEPQWT